MRKSGFTLIELLVVIAIIALLMAVIIPSLKTAKELATGAVCVSNQHQLALAWTTYSEDNDAYIVGGSNYCSSDWKPTPYRWVERPLYEDDDNPDLDAYPTDNEFNMQYRLNGIRAGQLYPYTQNEDLYHCPGDKTFVKESEPYAAWRSYAISGLMNGEDFETRESGMYSPIATHRQVGGKILYCVEKSSQIRSPSDKYVFVEEAYAGVQTYNAGSFVLVGNDNFDTWWDIPADYHNDKSTLGFADGHAENHKWQDPRTLALIQGKATLPNGDPVGDFQDNNPDLEMMVRGYMARP